MSENNKKINVCVIFGGRSGEHEVSLVSANSIIKALNPEKFNITTIGITKQGNWLIDIMPDDMSEFKNSPQLEKKYKKTFLSPNPGDNKSYILSNNSIIDSRSIDVVFPVLHGTFGEDGNIQGLLEICDIPYVGCRTLSSAIAMDKCVAKKLLRAAGLNIAPFLEYKRSDWQKNPDFIVTQVEITLGYPVFVKPANSGSSVGISKANDSASLKAALNEASRHDYKLLIESHVDGQEIEVSVMGNTNPIASVPGEIQPCNEFYDYSAKYIQKESKLLIPAKLSSKTFTQIKQYAIKAYEAIDCSGMARVDFFIDKQSEKIIINEINTIPGFTDISMYPKLWEASNIKYPQLVEQLIDYAFEMKNITGTL